MSVMIDMRIARARAILVWHCWPWSEIQSVTVENKGTSRVMKQNSSLQLSLLDIKSGCKRGLATMP